MKYVVGLVLAVATGLCAANTPPATPVVTQPVVDGVVVNPSDVHMESSAFSDADPGDAHVCSDWEIWTVAPSQVVWQTLCIGGVERVHTHMGDGVFLNSHAGRSEFLPSTNYMLRVRHKDSSGDPSTEWSGWGVRFFVTSPATAINPLELDDILSSPTPTLSQTNGAPFVLPASSPQPNITIESVSLEVILAFEGLDGVNNFINNPSSLDHHTPARLRLSAGGLSSDLVLPETNMVFTTDEGSSVTVYVPSARVSPGFDQLFWISETGATYTASAGQTEPDFSDLVRGPPVPWTVRKSGYVVDVVGTGYRLPVNIAFVPNPGPNPSDPKYYVTELYGSIKVVTNAGVVSNYTTGLLNFIPTGNFPGSGEQGLTGITVDPATGDLFVGYMRDYGGPHYPRVARFSSNDGGLTAASQTVLHDFLGESQGQSHQISNFSIGPDGKLYVHMGDGFDSNRGQDLDSYRGKVLRMNLDGSAPTDNPFYNAGDGINARDFVYAYGLRNPFGGAWRPSTGDHYEVENGPSVDRIALLEPGVNYLWDGSDASMYEYAIYNWVPAHGPTNIVFVDPSIFGGSQFPPSMQDHAFVAESGPTWASGPQSQGKRIVEYNIDPDGILIDGPNTIVEYTGSGKATAVGLAAGPDGLYFTDLYKDQEYSGPIDTGANVLRIRFIGDADFSADPTSGTAPLDVDFTDLSSVPGASAWFWEFGDGATSTAQNPSHTFAFDGIYDVRLTVTGDNGVRVAQKNGFIRVGSSIRIGIIGGSNPPTAADAAFASYLSGLGFDVESFDDEPGNRPNAQTFADGFDLVIIASSISSGNIAGEFANVDIPVIFWENALLSTSRMPMATSGTTLGDQTAINIINNTHPITEHVDLGQLQVYQSGATVSLGVQPYAQGVNVLAIRATGGNSAAIIAAETGAQLLGGQIAPARRVFFFFEDSGFLAATDAAKHLMEHAICWAAGLEEPEIVEGPQDAEVSVGDSVQFTVTATGASPLGYTWRHNGASIPNAGGPILSLANVQPGDAGTYEVEVTNICGEVVSEPAMLTVNDCVADLNNDGMLDFFDVQAFLNLFSGGDLAADFNNDQTLDFFDVLAFLQEFSAGCP